MGEKNSNRKNAYEYSIDDILREARELKKRQIGRGGEFSASDAPRPKPRSAALPEPEPSRQIGKPETEEIHVEQAKNAPREAPVPHFIRKSAAKEEPVQAEPARQIQKTARAESHPAPVAEPVKKPARPLKKRSTVFPKPEEKKEETLFFETKEPAKANPERQIRGAEAKTLVMDPKMVRTQPAEPGERFIKAPADQEAFSEKPPETIEKPAILKTRSKFDRTQDLDAVPTIVSVEDHLEQAAQEWSRNEGESPAPLPANQKDMVEGQIRLPGFDEEPPAPKVDEDRVEEQLLRARRKKVESFRIQTGEPADEFEEEQELPQEEAPVSELDDYDSPEDEASVHTALGSQKRRLILRSVTVGLAFVFLAALTVLHSPLAKMPVFQDPVLFASLALIFMAIGVLASITTVANGLRGIFTNRVDADSGLSFATLCVVAHTIFAVLKPELLEKGLSIYPLFLIFGYFLNTVGKLSMVLRVEANFRFCTAGESGYTLEDMESKADAQAIGTGFLMGEAQIKYGAKTKFPRRFLQISYEREPADILSRRVGYLSMGGSVLVAVLTFVLTKSWGDTVTAFAAAACITAPAGALLCSNAPLLTSSKKLAAAGGMICGFSGAEYLSASNAVVLDAAELFPQGSCGLHGIKTFGGMRVDEAILDTAAVVIRTHGPLTDVFDRVIEGKRKILPPVENVVYEDRMGASAWIYGRRVLVGNRELMVQHGVEMPPPDFEYKYRHDGRCLVYLALAGKVAAMFVVSYQADEAIRGRLIELERTGITLLLRTSDPNVDEEMLAQLFEVPEGYLRVLGSAAGRVYEKYSRLCFPKSNAYALYDGSAGSMLDTLKAAFRLHSVSRITMILQMVGLGIGYAIVAVLAFYGGLSQAGAWQMLLFQLVWTVLVLLVGRFKKNG